MIAAGTASGRTTEPAAVNDTVPQYHIDSTVVSAERSYVRTSAGGMIYDVKSDPDEKRMQIKEFMTKVPGISIDGTDGKLRYNHGRSYLILVNGKRNIMISNSRQYSMNLIKADYMRSIEILDPPPAEYNGYDIVINIVLDRDLPDGVVGYLGGSASLQERYNASADFTFKIGKFMTGLTYGYSYEEPRGTTYDYTREYYAEENTMTQVYSSESYHYATSHNLNFAASYDFTKKTSLTFSIGTDAMKQSSFSSSHSYELDNGMEQNALDILNKTVSSDEPSVNVKLGFNHSIKDGSISVRYNLDNNEDRTDYYRDGYSWNTNTSLVNSATINFSKRFQKKHDITLIAKYIHRDYGNSSDRTFSDSGGYGWNEGMDYIQQVAAIDGLYRFNSRHILLMARLKCEYTDNSGKFFQDEITPLKYSHFDFMPSFTAIYMTPGLQHISIMGMANAMRPGISQLNPYVDDSDPLNLRCGNPDLEPEIMYMTNIKFRQPLLQKRLSVTLSGGFSYIDNAIETFRTVNPDNTSITTYMNLGKRMNANASARISYNNRTINASATATYNWNTAAGINGEKLKNRGLNGSISIDMNLWKSGVISLWGTVNSIPAGIQDTKISADINYGFSFTQSIVKNKLSASISVSDPFRGTVRTRSTASGNNFVMNSVSERLGRNITLRIRWNFGKLRDRMKRQGGIADDLERYSPGI